MSQQKTVSQFAGKPTRGKRSQLWGDVHELAEQFEVEFEEESEAAHGVSTARPRTLQELEQAPEELEQRRLGRSAPGVDTNGGRARDGRLLRCLALAGLVTMWFAGCGKAFERSSTTFPAPSRETGPFEFIPRDMPGDEHQKPGRVLPARWPPPFHGHELALSNVAGRKEPVGEQFLQLRLAEPLVGRWKLAAVGDPPAEPAIESSDLRLEVRLLPKSLPRWRMVGSSTLNAAQDTTWIEFIGNKSDQVLKLKVDCQWTDSLRLVLTPYFQLSPDAPPLPLTAANREKAEQWMQWQGRRIQTQLQWLAARGGGGAGVGAGGGAGGGKKGAAGPSLLENRKLLEQQWKVVEAARARYEHLAELQRTLEQEGRVHVRLVSFTSGEELALTPCDPTA
ncbi:MAG: hypothetical protein U1A77_26215 [Pirellulales bacterium]